MSSPGQTESIVTGFWRNHDLPAWKSAQFLVTEQRAQMISNAVAVSLALTLPRLLVLVKLLLPFCIKQLSKWRSSYLARKPTPGRANQPRPDIIPLQPPRAGIAVGAAEAFNNASSFDDAAARFIRDHLAMARVELNGEQAGFWQRFTNARRNLREDAWTFAWLSTLSVVLFLVFIGQQIVAICATNIVTDSTALLASPHCGVWLSELYSELKLVTGKKHIALPLTNFANDRVLKSVSYAETCYGNNSRPEECMYFYKSKIPFREIYNSSCPFPGDVCLYGNSSAYTLDTGFLDSNILGINEVNRCQFRLRSTCTPLVAEEPYVQVEPVGKVGSKKVYYFFGNVRNITNQHPNLTFSWEFRAPSLDALIFRAKGYDIQEYPLIYDRHTSYHRFRPELRAPNSLTTIFFVFPHLFFSAPSDDPVFPAVPAPAYSGFSSLYWNTLQRHSMLGCADTVELRHPRSGAIWYPEFSNASELNSSQWHNPSVDASVRLLNLSLSIPEYFKAPHLFNSQLFEVHKKLCGPASTPLAREQWKVEARRLLTIRLARLQMDVLGVAQGLGHDFPLAKDALREGGSEECPQIKFRAQGWKNWRLVTLLRLFGGAGSLSLPPLSGYGSLRARLFLGMLVLFGAVWWTCRCEA
ncbi:MAG: hypothetical protein M1839_002694 [Geoglossum umbratile]|nr:MAG: hypothetical protein M1839_002694 [Geoglossum umbratile]